MNTSNDMPQYTVDPFFDTYIETLQVLYDLGIEFSFKQRIPIFRVYTHLDLLTNVDTASVQYAKDCLDILRRLMEDGMEPDHDGVKYR